MFPLLHVSVLPKNLWMFKIIKMLPISVFKATLLAKQQKAASDPLYYIKQAPRRMLGKSMEASYIQRVGFAFHYFLHKSYSCLENYYQGFWASLSQRL